MSLKGSYVPTQVLHTQDEGFLIAGRMDTASTYNSGVYLSPFLLKTDAAGNHIWDFYLFQHVPLPEELETVYAHNDQVIERDSDYVFISFILDDSQYKMLLSYISLAGEFIDQQEIIIDGGGWYSSYVSVILDSLILIPDPIIPNEPGLNLTAYSLSGDSLWSRDYPDLAVGAVYGYPKTGPFENDKILLASPTEEADTGRVLILDLEGEIISNHPFLKSGSFYNLVFQGNQHVYFSQYDLIGGLDPDRKVQKLKYWGSVETFVSQDQQADIFEDIDPINVPWSYPAFDGGIILRNYSEETFRLAEISPTGQTEQIEDHSLQNNAAIIGSQCVSVPEGTLLAYYQDTSFTLVFYENLGTDGYSLIEGNIFKDWNDNCLQDTLENGFGAFLVQIDTADASIPPRYALTNDSGYFSIAVDTGAYLVKAFYPYSIWGACQPVQSVYLPTYNDTTSVEFAQQVQIECPLLQVDIGAPFLRRCDTVHYVVTYYNAGTVAAEDASINIMLDPGLTFVEASIPLSTQNGDTLSFDLGTIPPDSTGTFSVGAIVDCDNETGQLHCTTAHIFPDSICRPAFPLWDGVQLEVDALCEGDSIVFTIYNVGDVDMNSDLNYFVIEDQIILDVGHFNLGAQESMSITVFSGGNAISFFTQTVEDFPFNAFPGITVEGCGNIDELWFGYDPAFPENDASPAISTDCQINRAPVDPNDKTGFPLGLDPDGLIERNMDLEYLIRFQNTGTDTAFLVVIRDTLSQHLDVSSLRVGAASHPFTWDVTGEGYLSFTFEDIMLPDSNVNEPASHGFVKFRIQQKPDLPLGSVINNRVGIYFDYNAPVITNTTQHVIGEFFVEILNFTPEKPSTQIQLNAYPNPFQEQAAIRIKGLNIRQGSLQLFDAQGRLLLDKSFSGSQVLLRRADLPPGLYFFRVVDGEELVGTGRLVKE